MFTLTYRRARESEYFLLATLIVLLAVLMIISGCAHDITPPQEAAGLHKLYDSIAAPAAKCVETPACKAKAGDEIKAADLIAFEYVKSANKAAQDWNGAPEDDKPVAKSTFDKVMELAKGAVAKLAALL